MITLPALAIVLLARSGDPRELGAASGVLFAAAVVASVIPALRATKVDPTIALRAE